MSTEQKSENIFTYKDFRWLDKAKPVMTGDAFADCIIISF